MNVTLIALRLFPVAIALSSLSVHDQARAEAAIAKLSSANSIERFKLESGAPYLAKLSKETK